MARPSLEEIESGIENQTIQFFQTQKWKLEWSDVNFAKFNNVKYKNVT